MTGIGIGTDIVEVRRIDRLIATGGEHFVDRWFAPHEIAYCRAKSVPSRHFAGRFAAKEAVVKVLPADPGRPLVWRWIEVVDTGGAPTVRLSGLPRLLAEEAGIGRITLSMSHCQDYATAVALAVYGGSL